MNNLHDTSMLLKQVSEGDADAGNELIRIYHPLLSQWARGRLPAYSRDLNETSDLVQETLIVGLRKAGEFNHRHRGAFLAYLRTILLNRIRKEIGQKKHPITLQVSQALEHSQLHQLNVQDDLLIYDEALQHLNPAQREAVVLRLEFGFSFTEIAELTDKPSANAARMYVARALEQLSEHMD